MKPQQLSILFEDDEVVVVDKPSGLLSLPDRFDVSIPNVRHLLAERYGQIFIVHRLDRETSGIMVAAKTAEAHKALNEQFEHHQVDKRYHAIVSGIVERDSFPIDIPIVPDPKRKGLMRPSARGKDARTEITVIERFRLATLIQCTLITGRTHQIRVHCSAIGHPLLVDPDYGTTSEFLLSAIKRRYNLKKETQEQPVIARLTLHAHELQFVHPTSNKPMQFLSPYPRDFHAAIKVLRKYSAPHTNTLQWD